MTAQFNSDLCYTLLPQTQYYRKYCQGSPSFWDDSNPIYLGVGIGVALITTIGIIIYCKWRDNQRLMQDNLNQGNQNRAPVMQVRNEAPQNLQLIRESVPERVERIELQNYSTQNYPSTAQNLVPHHNLNPIPSNASNTFQTPQKTNQTPQKPHQNPRQPSTKITQKQPPNRQPYMKYIFPPLPDMFYQTYIDYYSNLPIEHYPSPPPGFKYVPIDKNNKKLKEIKHKYRQLNQEEEGLDIEKTKKKRTKSKK